MSCSKAAVMVYWSEPRAVRIAPKTLAHLLGQLDQQPARSVRAGRCSPQCNLDVLDWSSKWSPCAYQYLRFDQFEQLIDLCLGLQLSVVMVIDRGFSSSHWTSESVYIYDQSL